MRKKRSLLLRTFRRRSAILKIGDQIDAEAEDAVQDAYLRAYRSFGSFRAACGGMKYFPLPCAA